MTRLEVPSAHGLDDAHQHDDLLHHLGVRMLTVQGLEAADRDPSEYRPHHMRLSYTPWECVNTYADAVRPVEWMIENDA